MRAYYDAAGRHLLSRHPGRPLVFLDSQLRGRFDELPNCRYEYLEYMSTDAVLEMARRYHASQGLRSVSTLDEKLVDLAAQVRTALGLAGMHSEQARRFRDKVLMKRLLGAAGVRVPDYVDDCADAAAMRALFARHGKIIVKPRDGMGSKGVECIDDDAHLEKVLERLRDPQEFEGEEFIEGTLYHTNSVVAGGQVLYTGVAPYLPGMANIDFGSGRPFCSLMETEGQLRDALVAFSERVIAALGMLDGVTHLEAFVNDEEIVFCEVAARPGGGGIVDMIEMQDGVNLSLAAMLAEEGSARLALGKRAPGASRIGLCGLRNAGMGTVQLDPAAHRPHAPWVQRVDLLVEDGQFRPPSAHCTDFTALVFLGARDLAQFNERIDAVSEYMNSCLRLQSL